MTESQRTVAVIGGGITGLAAAHRLCELAPRLKIVVLESGGRLGGVLHTIRQDGFLLEEGADNFITHVPWALDLCRRLNLEPAPIAPDSDDSAGSPPADGLSEPSSAPGELLQANSRCRHAFVVRRGRLRKVPDGFLMMAPTRLWPMLTTAILSPLGKLRLACEPFVRAKRDDEDESLASFATRRLGQETYDRLVQPLVSGVYVGDPDQLSASATVERFVRMEREHGSLTRAVRSEAAAGRSSDRNSSGARYSMFVAPREGMSSLIRSLAARLAGADIRLKTPVTRISRRSEGGWLLTVGAGRRESLAADAVIIATPAYAAAQLGRGIDPRLGTDLGRIRHARYVIASLGYRREQIGHGLDGFGCVVPRIEGRTLLSVSFSSVKYPGRAPAGHVLLRAFLHDAHGRDLAGLPDDELTAIAAAELQSLLAIHGRPVVCSVNRGPAMPQYSVGHRALVERIERRVAIVPGLELSGNAYHGVGVPQCIHSGQQAAERAVTFLRACTPSAKPF
ncbi:MAG: protoporphyrinogen oxidase [Planctomycetes bacterium]|nr:protoporphyrinogen oxidase [Planctomycetota bacterium]